MKEIVMSTEELRLVNPSGKKGKFGGKKAHSTERDVKLEAH